MGLSGGWQDSGRCKEWAGRLQRAESLMYRHALDRCWSPAAT